VIVGGGFGGLPAAKALKRTPAHVTLVDRNKRHLFQPLFYRNGLEQVTRFEPKAKIDFHGLAVKQIATNTSLVSKRR
jgi:NADH dehydrogenase FAD-containing subunit